jgi:hypothetical protein
VQVDSGYCFNTIVEFRTTVIGDTLAFLADGTDARARPLPRAHRGSTRLDCRGENPCGWVGTSTGISGYERSLMTLC